jgi:tetratricopeptide (TPR) repeat protein
MRGCLLPAAQVKTAWRLKGAVQRVETVVNFWSVKRRRKHGLGLGAGRRYGSGNRPGGVGTVLSPGRRRCFQILAVVLVPLLFLGALEVGLRIGGYGHPTTFFVPGEVEGEPVLVENSRFGLRFFPAPVARQPTPTVMKREKASDTVRVFLFGESAALGDPRPAYGVGRYVEVLLRERFPDSRFEVVTVAMTAINSHAVLPIARECAKYDADIWMVYMGNNEMVGPFGAATIFGPQTPSLGFIRTTLAVKSTRTGQALAALINAVRGSTSMPPTWGGMQMFLDQQVPPDDPRRGVVHAAFDRNLDDLVQVGLSSGAQVMLSTVAVNLRDCAPFGSMHRRGLTELGAEEWGELFEQAATFHQEEQWAEAARWYRAASALDDQHAELAYRMGLSELAQEEAAQAREAFQRAVDLDTLPFRADSKLNQLIRDIAERYREQGVVLVDAEAILAEQVPWGVPGHEAFYEHVHLTLEGNYQLGRALAEAMEPLLPATVRAGPKNDWASMEVCAERLGLTEWNRAAIYEEMLLRLAEAPFTGQANHAARMAAYRAELSQVRTRLTPETEGAARMVYEDALERSPGDHRLHANYAEFLEDTGRLDAALVQWRSVERLLPHHHVAGFHVGRLLARLGETAEARQYLEASLRRHPNLVDAMIELGQLHARDSQPQAAIEYYDDALRRQPSNALVYLRKAHAEAAAGDRAAAVSSLREAVRLRPGYWQAWYYLGVELATMDRIQEAESAFLEVVRVRPDFLLAHLNLGVALARQGRVMEASDRFRVVLHLDPENQRARQYLDVLERIGSAEAPLLHGEGIELEPVPETAPESVPEL